MKRSILTASSGGGEMLLETMPLAVGSTSPPTRKNTGSSSAMPTAANVHNNAVNDILPLATSVSASGAASPVSSDASFVSGSSHPFPVNNKESRQDKIPVIVAIIAWYIVGVLAIVTTKLQLQDWRCPPLVLTIQQMILGSILLRCFIVLRDGSLQPWPWDAAISLPSFAIPSSSNGSSTEIGILQPNFTAGSSTPDDNKTMSSTSSTTTSSIASTSVHSNSNNEYYNPFASNRLPDRFRQQFPWLIHRNFVLSGVFNALDFVASNYAFSFSSAHFVETIKASEPITTTAIALLWNVDRLSLSEAGSLSMLVAGVLLSTWGNSTNQQSSVTDERKLIESIQTAGLILSANVCFAFRAINQKRYRSLAQEDSQMDDINFLCRMLHVGATFLIGPIVFLHFGMVSLAVNATPSSQLRYMGLALVNAVSYVTYK